MKTHAQILASQLPCGASFFAGLVDNLIASAKAYQQGLDAELERKKTISANMRKAAQGLMISRGNYVSKESLLTWIKEHPGLARFEISEGTGGTRTRIGTLLSEMLEQGLVTRGGNRRVPTWSARQ